MAKAYWIAAYRSVNDPDALAAYAKLGGRILARGIPARVYDGGMRERTVLIDLIGSSRQSSRTTAPSIRKHWVFLATP
jgi:uncharacterized protein (DUF1330 family)